MKKKLVGLAIITAAFSLTGCSETFTFEAVPVGVDDDDAEAGIEGDPRQIECFTIEADSSEGDDKDAQLGTFCKTEDRGEGDDDE